VIKALKQRIELFSSPGKEFYLFLKSLLGFYPGTLRFYDIAFIHKSASTFDSHGYPVNNERLEYLGDAILGAVVADYLYNRFPHKDEGFLTQLRSRMVNRSFLTKLTFKTGLNRFVQSNTNSANETSHIYGDAFEALIGAIYLDKGYEQTKKFIVKRILTVYVDIHKLEKKDTNYKSQLIEWGQKNKKEVNFKTQDNPGTTGDKPPFVSQVLVEGKLFGEGDGYSKKESQQQAAKVALIKIQD
jgi:ribonuclease III